LNENIDNDLVVINYNASENANYITHVYFEAESPRAVKFTNQTSDKFFWIPKSMIKHGWKKDHKLPQDIKLNYSLELKWCDIE
jgi:hypothetical protein